MYTVIERFRDIDGTIYEIGEEYKGSKAKARIEQLTTDKNKYGYAFIEVVEEKVPADDADSKKAKDESKAAETEVVDKDGKK